MRSGQRVSGDIRFASISSFKPTTKPVLETFPEETDHRDPLPRNQQVERAHEVRSAFICAHLWFFTSRHFIRLNVACKISQSFLPATFAIMPALMSASSLFLVGRFDL